MVLVPVTAITNQHIRQVGRLQYRRRDEEL
jgi:hypothetical protein